MGMMVSVCGAQEPPAHVRTGFHFTLAIPFEAAGPLFGAWEERKWADDWHPLFLYPAPPADQEGAVFRVEHGGHRSVWVNTVFDPAAGHVQYVYVLNDAMATRIDIHLKRDGAGGTAVSVVYERTALMAEANAHVRSFAQNDAQQGAEWKAQIEKYWASRR